MAGFTQAYQQTLLDYAFPTAAATDHIAYSINGTSEVATIARTAIGATGWALATAATPSIKANNAALTSAAATGSGTASHFAIFSASTGGTQKTDWQAFTTAIPFISGTQITHAISDIKVTLD